MKKNVIIGSLVAGAFLLPAIASAGVVTGRCDKCHTMHASQDGVSTARNATLLKGAGCVGCHALQTSNNTTGVGGAFNAPQVIATTNTLSGGYFTTTGDDQHNVAPYAAADSQLGDVAPGGVDLGAQLTCVDCHTGSGSHHGTSGPYRMLSGVSGTGAGDYGVAGRSGNTYDSPGINGLCASCHPNFHTAAEQGVYGAWDRHPTDIRLADADTYWTGQAAGTRNYAVDYAAAIGTHNADDVTPLGTVGANSDYLMCLTCHVAHGSGERDMLAWSYGTVAAGGGTRDGGCENCHSYGTTGY